jgi:hypothetical protein
MSYADSKFLIYTYWDSGCLLLNSAITAEEAEKKVEMYTDRATQYNPNQTRQYIYINNRPEWWPAAAKLTADLPVE